MDGIGKNTNPACLAASVLGVLIMLCCGLYGRLGMARDQGWLGNARFQGPKHVIRELHQLKKIGVGQCWKHYPT